MFGLPDASLRWLAVRPGGMRTGAEIVEIKKASGKASNAAIRHRRTLVDAIVRDPTRRCPAEAARGPVVTSGAPVTVGNAKAKAVIVRT
jgi:hypothetical protein